MPDQQQSFSFREQAIENLHSDIKQLEGEILAQKKRWAAFHAQTGTTPKAKAKPAKRTAKENSVPKAARPSSLR